MVTGNCITFGIDCGFAVLYFNEFEGNVALEIESSGLEVVGVVEHRLSINDLSYVCLERHWLQY